uniref:RYYR-CCHC domain-containing protein n=1 Tax=Acrobeloides nanus TaxID=290746 RepID=A0A914DJ94_9BILA
MDVDNIGSILSTSSTADVIDRHSKVDSLEAVVSDENIKDGDILVRKLDSKPNVNVIRGATNPYSRKNPKPPFDIESEYSALLGFPAALAYLDSYIRGEILNFSDLRRLDYSRDLVLRLADKRRELNPPNEAQNRRRLLNLEKWANNALGIIPSRYLERKRDILAHQEESKVNSICKKGYLSDDLKPNLLMLQEDPAAGLRAFQLTCLDNDGSSAYECVGCKREETRETNETIPMLKISSDGLLETEYQSLKHHKNCVLASIPRFLADQLDKRARRQIALDLLPPHEAWREVKFMLYDQSI